MEPQAAHMVHDHPALDALARASAGLKGISLRIALAALECIQRIEETEGEAAALAKLREITEAMGGR